MRNTSNPTPRRLAIAFGIVGVMLAGCGGDQGGQGTSTTPATDSPGVATTAAPLQGTGMPTERPASAQTADANMSATSGTSDQDTGATAVPTERPASAQTADANITATTNAAP